MRFSIVLSFLALVLFFNNCNQPAKKASPVTAILSPEEAIKDFKIQDGFVAETVAAEPMIEDPVALCFDADANMWVVEMRGYMQGTEGEGENLPMGRIKILSDKDDDGIYETSSVFLDSLIMPRAVCWTTQGVLVAVPPDLWFYKNNNGKAGERILVDSQYADGGNVEHQPNTLYRARDNWIYSASGDKRYRYKNGQWLKETTQDRGQWGISQDDYGRLFYNNNSVTLLGDNFLPNAIPVNPYQRFIKNTYYDRQLVDNRVYPRAATPGVNRGYDPDVIDSSEKLINVTAACGPVIYRGDNFPKEYYGNAFVLEPAAFLVKRIILSEDSGIIKGRQAYNHDEFLTATDERFRPVNAYTSPDGTLYIVDMHRGIIQHTTYLTPYLRKRIDSLHLERPIHMGRIFRIKWKANDFSKKEKLSNLSSTQLIKYFSHPNGWYRDMAQQLLVEKQDLNVIPQLQQMAADATDPVRQDLALWTLEGLDGLSVDLLKQTGITTNNRQIRNTCMLLLCILKNDPNALDALMAMRKKDDKSSELLFTASLASFAGTNKPEVMQTLSQIAEEHKNDPGFTDMIISGINFIDKPYANSLKKDISESDTVFHKAFQAALTRFMQPKNENLDYLTKAEQQFYYEGKSLFEKNCATCHGKTGDGIENLAPPLAGSEWAQHEDKTIPIRILLDGLAGPLTVNGVDYNFATAMPALRNNVEINNGDIAGVITYIRNSWGNKAGAISVEEVGKVRSETAGNQGSYTQEKLEGK